MVLPVMLGGASDEEEAAVRQVHRRPEGKVRAVFELEPARRAEADRGHDGPSAQLRSRAAHTSKGDQRGKVCVSRNRPANTIPGSHCLLHLVDQG